MSETLTEKLENHRLLQAKLSAAKDAEMLLRLEICKQLGIDGLAAKTHHFDYENEALHVVMVKKLNYSLDNDVLPGIDLTDEEKECIKWTPTLILGKYNKLDNSGGLDIAITVKDAAPSLNVSLTD